MIDRIVWVPHTIKWITRFNKRFAIRKNWDGTFSSRLGFGHCIYSPSGYMGYSFNLD
jgi:hypothetical protein